MPANLRKIKTSVSKLLSEQGLLYLKHGTKLALDAEYRQLEKIRKLPRYTSISTKLLGAPLTIVDGLSFYHSYHEIFSQEIYAFKTAKDYPMIIDGGANIGLSMIYFKTMYPNSKIVAFEADPDIFQVLQINMLSFGFNDVIVINKALWHSETLSNFVVEGADGGRIAHNIDRDTTKNITVPTVRLRDYIVDKNIDLLKLDVEGAETEIILDCADCLHHVEKLFIEYHSFANEEQKLDELLHVLRKSNFRIHIHSQFVASQPLLHRPVREGIDMQLNIFGYRD